MVSTQKNHVVNGVNGIIRWVTKPTWDVIYVVCAIPRIISWLVHKCPRGIHTPYDALCEVAAWGFDKSTWIFRNMLVLYALFLIGQLVYAAWMIMWTCVVYFIMFAAENAPYGFLDCMRLLIKMHGDTINRY